MTVHFKTFSLILICCVQNVSWNNALTNYVITLFLIMFNYFLIGQSAGRVGSGVPQS